MNDTKIELQRLWQIGVETLPAMANIYAESAEAVNVTHSKQANLFETPGMPEGTKGTADVGFGFLRDQLQVLSRQTCINLRDSGAGCARAANELAERDLTHAEQLEYAAENEEYSKEHKVTPPEDPPKP